MGEQQHGRACSSRRSSAASSARSILVFAYFVGIALVGAGLGALVAHVVVDAGRRRRAAACCIVMLLAVAGAIAAMFLQRYVIIVSTAFGGAWTIMSVGWLLVDRGAARRRRPTCGFCIRSRRRRSAGGCRSRGSRSAWPARPCSLASPARRRK